MGILTGILFAIVGILLIIVIKQSTTFFHEMGHAIPALLFTDKSVNVYIGSYGDISNTTKFHLGRLTIYFKLNLFDWKLGMCSHEENPEKTWQKALIILGGPIASLMIAMPLLMNLRSLQNSQVAFYISVVFIIAAIFDFATNMIPTSMPLKMHDGSVAYCDGFALYMLFLRSSAPTEYFEIEKLFKAKKYDEVIESGSDILVKNPNYRFAYEFMIQSLIKQKDIDGALELYHVLKHNLNLIDADYFEIGKLYKANGNYTEALKFFDHYRYKNFHNIELLNEIAQTYLELSENEKAIETIDALMVLKSDYLNAYVTRSHALINVREYELAQQDLEFVFSKDDQIADANFVYGLLYENLNDNKKALFHYEKAEALHCEMHGLDFRIASVREI